MYDDLDLYRRADDGWDPDVTAKLRKENAELRKELQDLRWLEADRKNLIHSKWFAAFAGCFLTIWQFPSYSRNFFLNYVLCFVFSAFLALFVLFLIGIIGQFVARSNSKLNGIVYLAAALLLPLILALFSGSENM